jgi:hypothetical protein
MVSPRVGRCANIARAAAEADIAYVMFVAHYVVRRIRTAVGSSQI